MIHYDDSAHCKRNMHALDHQPVAKYHLPAAYNTLEVIKWSDRTRKQGRNRIMKEEILKILEKNSRLTAADIAAMIGASEEEVAAAIAEMEKEKIICGYSAVINWEKANDEKVMAQIGVKISPVRGEGFDRIAERISRFEEVDSVYLMSGASYDLILTIEGESMKDISHFVYEKIAPMETVLSTSTFFVLKKYKEHNVLFNETRDTDERIQIMP